MIDKDSLVGGKVQASRSLKEGSCTAARNSELSIVSDCQSNVVETFFPKQVF